MISRFAPSTTGEPHPGTLLSALLVWLDARARGGRALLRLEDLDVTRCKAIFASQLLEACTWLGLADWDEVIVQSQRGAMHEAALDQLAATGRLYPCGCTRRRKRAVRAPDGGWAYDNACRGRSLVGSWRETGEPLRLRLDDDRVTLVDDGGVDLSQTPAREMGDPIVRRRDGVIAYHLVVVVDDAAAGITDVIRGRDIAPSTATQVSIQRLLGLSTPRYRHHLLLLERSGAKLAKLHKSLPYSQLRARYDGPTMCGVLANLAGLASSSQPCTPEELVSSFNWSRVRRDDVVFEPIAMR